MNDHPHRRKTDKWTIRPVSLSFIALTIIFFLVLLGFGIVVHNVQHNGHSINSLVKENSNRIKEIQKSRVDSCEQTYKGIREVFKPFFPKHPKSHREIENLDKFNTTIDNLIKACVKQTKPKPIPKGGNS
jgi:hypothetical protein